MSITTPLNRLLSSLREAIHPNLLLLVLGTMALFQLGRGPGNVLWGSLAIAAALIVCCQWRIFTEFKTISLCFFAFVLAISVGGIADGGNYSPVVGSWPLKYWLSIVFSSLVFFQLQMQPLEFEKQRNNAAYLALGAAFVVLLNWFYFSFVSERQPFNPAEQISSTIAVVIAPWVFFHRGWSVTIKWLIAMVMMVLLMGLDSRTELLALLSALSVYQICCWRRLRWLLLLLPLLLLLLIVPDLMAANSTLDLSFASVNEVSSLRMGIWQAAWEKGNDSVWFGHGLYSSVRAPFLPDSIRHVHNVFVELYYETGVFGLLSISAFMLLAYGPLLLQCKHWPKPERRFAAIILACSAATFVVLFFDKSLHTVYARYYLFFLAGLAFALARQQKQTTQRESSEKNQSVPGAES